jgi:hypothetical protein
MQTEKASPPRIIEDFSKSIIENKSISSQLLVFDVQPERKRTGTNHANLIKKLSQK